jgi:hypothetical protein
MAKRHIHRYHQDGTIPIDGSVFVFGSNLAGLHGRGAALIAKDLYHAQFGVGIGFVGRSYAIPVKDRFVRKLNVKSIIPYVNHFIAFTHDNPEMRFFVTRVGCGYAGYKNWEIAPLFRKANTNCSFPHLWKPFVK